MNAPVLINEAPRRAALRWHGGKWRLDFTRCLLVKTPFTVRQKPCAIIPNAIELQSREVSASCTTSAGAGRMRTRSSVGAKLSKRGSGPEFGRLTAAGFGLVLSFKDTGGSLLVAVRTKAAEGFRRIVSRTKCVMVRSLTDVRLIMSAVIERAFDQSILRQLHDKRTSCVERASWLAMRARRIVRAVISTIPRTLSSARMVREAVALVGEPFSDAGLKTPGLFKAEPLDFEAIWLNPRAAAALDRESHALRMPLFATFPPTNGAHP